MRTKEGIRLGFWRQIMFNIPFGPAFVNGTCDMKPLCRFVNNRILICLGVYFVFYMQPAMVLFIFGSLNFSRF